MARDSNARFSEISTNWVYRQTVTFEGSPFVLLEKERVLMAEDKYDDPQVDGVEKVATGDLKLEPLRDAIDERSRQKVVESFNGTPNE